MCFATEVTELTHGQKGKGASESKQEIPECQGQNACKTEKKKNVLSFLGKERRKEQGKNEERSAQQSILHWGRDSREGYLH